MVLFGDFWVCFLVAKGKPQEFLEVDVFSIYRIVLRGVEGSKRSSSV